MKSATILSIGDELVTGQTVDTNASWLAGELGERGFEVEEIRSVPDDRPAIADAIRSLTNERELLLVTGGLGPTADDLTREALGDVMTPGEPLAEDEAGVAHIASWFQRSGRTPPEINNKQALRPVGTTLIENPHGTAPGIAARIGACHVFLMPGVPREMKHMYAALCASGRIPCGASILLRGSIETAGIGESTVAERLGELLVRTRSPRVGTTSSRGIVAVRIYARGQASDIASEVASTSTLIEHRLNPYAYGRNGATLPETLGSMLRARRMTLATAESCTGGLIAKMVTDVPGSSEWFDGGLLTYTNALKSKLLGVDGSLFERCGAVSREVVEQMLQGAMHTTEASASIAVSGIAGPGGGTESKPVGTVFIGVASAAQPDAAAPAMRRVRRFLIPGDRASVRLRTAVIALQMLRLLLLDALDGASLLWEERPASAGGDA